VRRPDDLWSQSVTFNKADSDLEMYAKELKEGGLVGEVNCHRDR
jgi:hypothetical protein